MNTSYNLAVSNGGQFLTGELKNNESGFSGFSQRSHVRPAVLARKYNIRRGISGSARGFLLRPPGTEPSSFDSHGNPMRPDFHAYQICPFPGPFPGPPRPPPHFHRPS